MCAVNLAGFCAGTLQVCAGLCAGCYAGCQNFVGPDCKCLAVALAFIRNFFRNEDVDNKFQVVWLFDEYIACFPEFCKLFQN